MLEIYTNAYVSVKINYMYLHTTYVTYKIFSF
jgi:hypothetical protein